MSNAVIDHLLARKSPPLTKWEGPAPTEDEIRTMIAAACRVPDHGKLAPWRFILYAGDSREKIGVALAEIATRRGIATSDPMRDKERERFTRAPLVIGVISTPFRDHKIPEWEQTLSAGAAAMNLVHAATALGFAAMWLTNWFAFDDEALAVLGLEEGERVAGFIHIGRTDAQGPERPRPTFEDKVSRYSGPRGQG